MARLRKSEPEPTAPEVSSLAEEATIEERTRYLIQEIGKDAGFLEKWIIHYLAELLERTDDRKITPRARSAARAEIARVIPTLWEQQIAREALRIRYKTDNLLHRTDTLNKETEQLLRDLFSNSDRTAELTENESLVTLRALHVLTEMVTRFLLTAASAEWARHEVTSEAVRRFLHEEMQGLQEALARVIPDFATLDPTELLAIERLAHRTLLSLAQAQISLLTRSTSGVENAH